MPSAFNSRDSVDWVRSTPRRRSSLKSASCVRTDFFDRTLRMISCRWLRSDMAPAKIAQRDRQCSTMLRFGERAAGHPEEASSWYR